MSTPADRVLSCTVCLRTVGALFKDAGLFGSRIVAGKAGERGMQICDDHLPLIVAVTAPRELAGWLLEALGPRDEPPKGFCYLCETAIRAEAEALRQAGPRGVACGRHGPSDSRELGKMKELLVRIAAGERLLYMEELSAIRAALIARASMRGSQAHVLKLE